MAPSEDPPEGFTVRDAGVDDAPAIAALVNAVTTAEVGLPWTDGEQVADALTAPGRGFGLEDLVLVDAAGDTVGYLEFETVAEPRQVEMIAFVHPSLWGQGVNAWLLRRGEERARAGLGADARVPLRVARFAGNEPAGRLFASLGYRYVRTFWVMRIEFVEVPPRPRVPDGIAIRTFEPERDEVPTYAALAEGFAEHWGSPFPTFDEWRHLDIRGEGSRFDPSLWYLATEGDEVVGAALCTASSPRAEDTAIVGDLAVRGPWRRRGVALALLQTAFAEFHRRGIPRAELSVDAGNATGATRLYERAGMTEVLSWEFWEKSLDAKAPVSDREGPGSDAR